MKMKKVISAGMLIMFLLILMVSYPSFIHAEESAIQEEALNFSIKELKINEIIEFETQLSQSVPLIEANEVHQIQINGINLTGTGETICVIDTGIDFSHPALIGKNKTCNIYCNPNGDACTESCSVTDLNGHGTHVAGIAAASGPITGVAPGASLIGVKVFSGTSGNDTTVQSMANGIDWCVDNSEEYNISVITMSIGTSSPTLYSSYSNCQSASSTLDNSISNAVSKNISMTIASGNDGNWTHISLPACMPDAIPVGDVYDANVGGIDWVGVCIDSTTFADKIVCHANRNSLVKLFAPGAFIYSSTPSSTYTNLGGTSMATPHVAGAIAVINQFMRTTGISRTPEEIESLLNSTGKKIDDSASGLSFSRIDLQAAITTLDYEELNVTLSYPADNYKSDNENVSFICNSSAITNLTQVNFNLWGSNGLVSNQTLNVSGFANSTSFNFTLLPEQAYEWNCIAKDYLGSQRYANNNFSVIYDTIAPQITIISPVNGSWQNAGRFNVSLNEPGSCNYSLDSGITNISMGSNNYNFSSINSTLAQDSQYSVIFYCEDNLGNKNTSTSSFSIDMISPEVNLSTPEEEYSATGATEISFVYNASDNLNLSRCSLLLNDVEVSSNSTQINESNNIITYLVSPASYLWRINCFDSAGNNGTSESRQITINSVVSTSTTSGGGGGGGSTIQTAEIIKKEQIMEGYTKEFTQNQEVMFEMSGSGGSGWGNQIDSIGEGKHTLRINKVGENYVDIVIRSDPIFLTLKIGESRKLNLTSWEYYDLFVKVESVSYGKANITLREIKENIIAAPENNTFSATNNEPASEGIVSNETKFNDPHYIFYALVVVILAIIYLLYHRTISRERSRSKKKITKKISEKYGK